MTWRDLRNAIATGFYYLKGKAAKGFWNFSMSYDMEDIEDWARRQFKKWRQK